MEKSPQTLEKQGVPRGYCGFCIICKKPGHLRHSPGMSPSTLPYCDEHYMQKMIQARKIGYLIKLVMILVFLGLSYIFFNY